MPGEEGRALAPRRGDTAVDAVPVLQPRGDVDLRLREHRRPRPAEARLPVLSGSPVRRRRWPLAVPVEQRHHLHPRDGRGARHLDSGRLRLLAPALEARAKPVPRLLHIEDDAVPRAARALVLHPQLHRADRHLLGAVLHLLHLPAPHGDLADEGVLRLDPLRAGGVRVDRGGRLVPHLPPGHPPAGIQRVRRHVGVRVHLLLHRVHVRLDLHPYQHDNPAALHRRPSPRRGRSGSS